MHPRTTALLALFALTAGPAATAKAETAPQHLLPQSIQVASKETMEQLTELSRRKGPVGAAAKKALGVYVKHEAREREFILPPLTLLPYLAEGKVTPDMAWALAMTDRVRAEREQIFEEHTRLTDALSSLAEAATKAHDKEAKEFAEFAATDDLNDMEILEPTLLLINDILRAKLPAAH
ncbi:MAG TPA: hypothetical protein DDZ81_05870 [Acetobacteraceae bacterium]|jgi:hypothetical protein|nr:hypothetical protein [Acetobacteraceae bacterium]